MNHSRPWTVILAVCCSLSPILIILFSLRLIPVFLIFLPTLFVVYRLWMGDNIARWFASCLLLIVVATGIYSLWAAATFESPEETIAITNSTNTITVLKGATAITPLQISICRWLMPLVSISKRSGSLISIWMPRLSE